MYLPFRGGTPGQVLCWIDAVSRVISALRRSCCLPAPGMCQCSMQGCVTPSVTAGCPCPCSRCPIPAGPGEGEWVHSGDRQGWLSDGAEVYLAKLYRSRGAAALWEGWKEPALSSSSVAACQLLGSRCGAAHPHPCRRGWLGSRAGEGISISSIEVGT